MQSAYPLPNELRDHAPVTVLTNEGMEITVRDAAGREWKLFHWQVDAGREYRGPSGNWMHESDPAALTRLREIATTLQPDRCEHALQADVAAALQDTRWILAQNGH